MRTGNMYIDFTDLASLGVSTIIGVAVRIRYPKLCRIGDHSIIDDFTYISCALDMGIFSGISANCTLLGGGSKIFIGDFVNIGPGCQIISACEDYVNGGLAGPCIPSEFKGKSISKDIVIDNFVLLGAQTVVLPGAVLPEGMATGAMTLVTEQEYEPWMVYGGIPARPLKKRKKDDIIKSASDLLRSIRGQQS